MPERNQLNPLISLSLTVPSSPALLTPSAPAAMPLFLVVLLLLTTTAFANKFTVGDAKGWNPGVNYTLWVNKHRPFYIGDWLVFYYQSGMADVVQVDETAYDKCDSSHPISNYSKGRSYAFELNQTKRFYFICSYGYCYQGMKVSVLAHPLPSPPPPPSRDHSYAGITAFPSISVVLIIATAAFRFLF